MSKLPKEQIKQLARLARLKLSPQEARLYESQLTSILDYAEKLNQVETSGVEPTAHVTGLTNISRNDLAIDDNQNEKILGQAPDTEEKSYRVKAVFDNN